MVQLKSPSHSPNLHHRVVVHELMHHHSHHPSQHHHHHQQQQHHEVHSPTTGVHPHHHHPPLTRAATITSGGGGGGGVFTRVPSRPEERKWSSESMTTDERKLSMSGLLSNAQEGLANSFAADELSPEDLIYNLFKIPNKQEASIGRLLMVLKNYGLQETDPRLLPMMKKIKEIETEREASAHEAKDPRHWKLGKADFKLCIAESISLITQSLQNDLVVPSWGQFTQIIKEIYTKCRANVDGRLADYIPQLKRVNPDYWGMAICTVDGQRYSLGDSRVPFCCQSVSKAFNYAIAASELGAELIHQFVGQEPSGIQFNSISLDATDKPHNPMVNAGAIIVASLIQNKENMADRFDYVLTQYKKIAGGEFVGFNNAVFLSERSTADRNFALAYYMKEKHCFPEETQNLTEALDFYFQLCSLEVTCESAAVMAATLANGGVCPITAERCIGSRSCRDLLSLMNSCGMYDYSGQFAFHVGLPAKSGVSGVMIVVVPNLVGIALYSPRLDHLGNSCRGVEFCKEMVQRFNFHNYDSLAHSESTKFDPRRRFGDREKDQVVSLLFAAKAGDINTIRRMYMQGCDLELSDYDKRTALHLAASENHFDVALFLLNTAKVRPDPKDRWNRTPLHDAKSQNHLQLVHLLEKAMAIAESQEDEDEISQASSANDLPEGVDKQQPPLNAHPHLAESPSAVMNMSFHSLQSQLSSIPPSSNDSSESEDDDLERGAKAKLHHNGHEHHNGTIELDGRKGHLPDDVQQQLLQHPLELECLHPESDVAAPTVGATEAELSGGSDGGDTLLKEAAEASLKVARLLPLSSAQTFAWTRTPARSRGSSISELKGTAAAMLLGSPSGDSGVDSSYTTTTTNGSIRELGSGMTGEDVGSGTVSRAPSAMATTTPIDESVGTAATPLDPCLAAAMRRRASLNSMGATPLLPSLAATIPTAAATNAAPQEPE